MILSLRQIKSRIRSIENVKKVTHAMELISVAKFRVVENKALVFKQYYSKIEGLLKNLLTASAGAGISNPYIVQRGDAKKTALCLVTSDTGLCASYNNNVIRLAEGFIGRRGKEKILLFCVGRKGFNHFRKKNIDIAQGYIGLTGRFNEEITRKIFKDLTSIYLSGKVDEVWFAYTDFESASRHKVVIEKFLNMEAPQGVRSDYILEPDAKGVLEELIPEYLFGKVKAVLLEAFASEHSSRMLAMGQATNNARELLEGLILRRNKMRQANITKEIIEIISSAEVLR